MQRHPLSTTFFPRMHTCDAINKKDPDIKSERILFSVCLWRLASLNYFLVREPVLLAQKRFPQNWIFLVKQGPKLRLPQWQDKYFFLFMSWHVLMSLWFPLNCFQKLSLFAMPSPRLLQLFLLPLSLPLCVSYEKQPNKKNLLHLYTLLKHYARICLLVVKCTARKPVHKT